MTAVGHLTWNHAPYIIREWAASGREPANHRRADRAKKSGL